MGSKLEGEAGEIVALLQILKIVDAAGEICRVDAGEGVDLAGVAADGQEDGVDGDATDCVLIKEGDIVWVVQRALVPVFYGRSV